MNPQPGDLVTLDGEIFILPASWPETIRVELHPLQVERDMLAAKCAEGKQKSEILLREVIDVMVSAGWEWFDDERKLT